jgi:2'-N-acetylparomamine deacetylase / 2'''-acetyl-6'''-hydroxyneomycin deacetylase
VALSCAARLLSDVERSGRVLVLTLFGPGLDGPFEGGQPHEERRARALVRLGVAHLTAGFPAAPRRSSQYASYAGLLGEREASDDHWLHQAVDLLNTLSNRVRPRQVYVPLGVGGHVDHRLAHEAARAVFPGGDGRNVFLYEERPEAFVRGAVRLCLGRLGARLPPAAVHAADGASLAHLILRSHAPAAFRRDLGGLSARFRAAGPLFQSWRASRVWHPLRALGPRLQPVVYPTHPSALAGVRELGGSFGRSLDALGGRYLARLGGGVHAERYWLLLPPREADGVETLPPGAMDVPARLVR